MKFWPVLAAALALVAGTPALAQEDAEEALVAELIVQAYSPGPGWWKVSDANSTVWILGAPQGLPKAVTWDQKVLDRKLYKANVLLLPPDYDANIFGLLFYFLTNARKFRSETPVSQTLPPELAQRLEAAVSKMGGKVSDYDRLKPVGVALTLSGRFQGPLQMERREPERAVIRMARKLRVKRQRVAGYDLMPIIRSIADTPAEQQVACLDAVLKQVEAGREPMVEAARGWARGDIRTAVAAERGADRCVAVLPGIAKSTTDTMADTAEAIAKALQTPGKSVALVQLRPLLAKNGVIERLQAKGLTVVSPAEPVDESAEEAPPEDLLNAPDEPEEPEVSSAPARP